ncbi:hypothetical protein KJ562_02870 [Patescibacteria group bacterium]|nr:hypothetical protein [Patescibacteria group bacterium]MBU4162179.1 hypothetical protein [Patescibacteria group bacterium]
MLSIIISYIFFIIALIFLLSLTVSSFSIAPWVPCKKKDLERINRLAGLKSGELFCELGCGDGRVCRYIAKKNPESRIVGIELSLPIFLWAKLIELFFKSDNMKIKFGNALKYNLSEMDVIYTYALVQSINGKLKNKFEKEMKNGAKVLSYAFIINEWKGKTYFDRPDSKSLPIYIYEF